MTYGLTPRQKEARGVVTSGEGKHTTAHLNLTVTLADIDARRRPKASKPRKMGRPPGPNLVRARYAGDERYEPKPSTAIRWNEPAFPNRFAAKRRKDPEIAP